MELKPISFKKIFSGDRDAFEEFQRFLARKERQLAKVIYSHSPVPRKEDFQSEDSAFSLEHALDVFTMQVYELIHKENHVISRKHFEKSERHIHQACWEYAEVLEGSLVECFQELDRVHFEEWNKTLLALLEQCKDILLERIVLFKKQVQRIEKVLWKYQFTFYPKGVFSKGLSYLGYLLKRLLGTSLKNYIKKSARFLVDRFALFLEKYKNAERLKEKIAKSLAKFQAYPIFSSLGKKGHAFQELYRLLKFWTFNRKYRLIPDADVVRSLRSRFSVEEVRELGGEYYEKIKEALLEISFALKGKEKPNYSNLTAEILRYRGELHCLSSVINQYREFYLRTHPNPYVRTRWGFSEWSVAPEPKPAKTLLFLLYSIEKLEKYFESIEVFSRSHKMAREQKKWTKLYRDIQYLLHEMSQPLLSPFMMKTKAEKLVTLLQQVQEVASPFFEVVEKIDGLLLKAIRADWQTGVLFTFPAFREIYHLHCKLIEKERPSIHQERLKRLQALQGDILEEVGHRNQKIVVEEKAEEMKEILSELLCAFQESNEPLSAMHALLILRFSFGMFFTRFKALGMQGNEARKHFLFIEGYLETLEMAASTSSV